MDDIPYDLTERQVYEVGLQVAGALVSLLVFTAFFSFFLDYNTRLHGGLILLGLSTEDVLC